MSGPVTAGPSIHRFREALIDSFDEEQPLREFHGSEMLVLSELGTYVDAVPRQSQRPVDQLHFSTVLCTDVPRGPQEMELLSQLNSSESLNRWVLLAEGALVIEGSVAVPNSDDERRMRLCKLMLETQLSRARAALFSGLHDQFGGSPFLIGHEDTGYLRWEEAHSAVHSIEREILPHSGRTDLWSTRLARLRRGPTLSLPPYAPYQGPGWLGFTTPEGARIQIPWTSVDIDYGVIEIRDDRFLDFSEGETVELGITYQMSDPWGAGLELAVDLPVHPETFREAARLAGMLNHALRVPAFSSGIGQFVAPASGIRYRVFLPAAFALDETFALWLLERVLVSMAMHVQETRAVLEGGPAPMYELGTAPL